MRSSEGPQTPEKSRAGSSFLTSAPLRGWGLRTASENNATLRAAFLDVLAASAVLPPEQRLIMYDAEDGGAVSRPLAGGVLRKRLDARRNTKPKKPDAQHWVCTPFDHAGFHFGKIKNSGERLLSLELTGGRYEVLTNKFPLFPKHMLLVCTELVPQQMTQAHLRSIGELIRPTSFCAYFNSWCASASVNHFHCHVIDELPPVARMPLVAGPPLASGVRPLQPRAFPGNCYVFEWSQLEHVAAAIWAMQEDNQPHNLLFTPAYVYVWPKPLQRPERSFELYPETVGGPELLGSFTVYQEADFARLTQLDAAELFQINTAPLPARLRICGRANDDSSIGMSASATTLADRRVFAAIRPSQSFDSAEPRGCLVR